MEKTAIFVEGQTERIFVEKLITEMAGARHFHVDAVQGHGGGRLLIREWNEIHVVRPDPRMQYYFIIYESMNDGRVLSDIREQYASLTAQGFSVIAGLRDVYPRPRHEIPTIRSDFATYVPAGPVTPVLVLGVMEIEAWFLAEHTHFARVHAALSLAAVTAALGYDPSVYDVSQVGCPSDDLRAAYAIAGLGYNKSRTHAERTVNELSYEEIYESVRVRIDDLDALIGIIDDVFSRGPA